MARRFFLCLTLACSMLLLATACTKTETTVTETVATDDATATGAPTETMPVDTATVVTDTVMTTDTTATTTTITGTATTSAVTIGVAECDNYLTKLNACVTTKMPAEARAQWESTLNQTRSSWQQLSANPQTRASLAMACQSAADMARQSLQAYNCEF